MRVIADGNDYRHHMVWLIPERDTKHANKALNSSSRSGHQQQSQSNLAGNERGVQAPALDTASEASRTSLHHLADLRVRRLQRGKQAEDDSAQYCQSHAEIENRKVDVEVRFVGIGVIGQPRDEEPDRPISDKDSQTRSNQGYEKRFGEKLAHDAKAAGSHGRAHRKLMLTRCAPCEEQDREISAADREQQG